MNVFYLCDKQNPECEKTNCGGDYCHHTADVNHAANFKPIVDQVSGEVIGYMEKESVELDESVIQEVLNKRHMTVVANEYLAALHSKGSQDEWIPVSERLPEERINPNTNDFEDVLCSTIWDDVRPYKYGKPIGHDKAHFWHGGGIMDKYITAWQSLPERYEPKEKENG